MICHDISHDFPHQIPTTSSQELLCSRQNRGPLVHPGVPSAGETGGTRGNLVGKRTSCPWINSLKTQLPRLHGSLPTATPECWIRQTFPDGESKGNHPQTTIRNVKQMRYVMIYIYIHNIYIYNTHRIFRRMNETIWLWLKSLGYGPKNGLSF